jgi:Skp family chaperone for outer membrane proteins
MEREMKEREEELRKAVEMEKQEREERRQRVKKQLERLHRESRFAVSLFLHSTQIIFTSWLTDL